MRFAIVSIAALALAGPVQAQQAPVPEAQLAAPSRFVFLEGGRNFRDMGGYRTVDGKLVKSGVLYRSGSPGGLTPRGLADLQALHVAAIVDLRTTDERRHDSVDLPAAFGPRYWTRDYGMSVGDMRSVFSGGPLTADSIRAMMIGVYRRIPREQAPSYRELFARLAQGKGPTVVNCTAGKDRTGVAAALVLTALGVPYETVRRDFLLSNGAPGMETLQSGIGPLAKLPPDVVAPLVGVEAGYLDTAFAAIRQDFGSVEGYLRDQLGVGPREIAALRRQMLDRGDTP